MKSITICVLLLICNLTNNLIVSMENNHAMQSCELCIAVVEKRVYKEHKQMHFNQLKMFHQCNACFILITTLDELRQHALKHNPHLLEKPYQCAKCNNLLATKGSYMKHLVARRHSLYPKIDSQPTELQRPFKIKKEDSV